VARPDAARPVRRQRPERIHDRPRHRGLPVARRAARLVEFRGVPGRHRARRKDRRRPDTARVAPRAAVPVAVVADRVALPLQREVPAGVAAAIPVVPGYAGPPPHRGCRPGGGGVSGAAAPAQAAARTGVAACTLMARWPPRRRYLEASPSLVYGAALLMRLGF